MGSAALLESRMTVKNMKIGTMAVCVTFDNYFAKSKT